MRDDIRALFKSLNSLLPQKLALLNSILSKEPEKRYLVKTGSIDKLLQKIENDDEILGEIDILDYEMTRLRENICDICGIQADSFDSFFENEQSEQASGYFRLYKEIHRILDKLASDREVLLQLMHEKGKSAQADWKSLKKTIQLSKIIKQ